MPKLLNEYLDFDIELSPEDEKCLPLYHVCSQDEMLTYLMDKKIVVAEECNVLHRKILYTFYGASKYNSGKTFINTSKGDVSVCMVLDINHCTSITNIYPLDTGLASGTVPGTREYFIPWEKIEKKLDLGNQKSRINKIILHCFENIESYIDGNLVIEGDAVKAKFMAPGDISNIDDLHTILKDLSTGDERRYCVEVLFEEELDLMPKLLIAVIASQNLLKNSRYLARLDEYRMTGVILKNNLHYPTSFKPNLDVERKLTEISKEFSKKRLME